MTSPWLVEHPAVRDPRRVLVCLPYAGGGASVYVPWRQALPDTEIVAVRAPGRESRFREPPLEAVDAVVDGLAPAVAELLAHRPGLPWAVFGYSLGALLAYELVSRLSGAGGPVPAALVVGGSEAPQVPRIGPTVSTLGDADFADHLLSMGGTPPEIFEHPELVAMLLPTVRADFRLLESYAWSSRPALSVPIVTHRATDDRELRAATVRAWADLTTAETTHRTMSGGHFVLNDRPELFAARVGEDLHWLV